MEIIGYLASVLIGVSLGLIGGGGSILTVPVLAYLFHIHPVIATSYSLFIVGTTSAIGTIPYFKQNLIDIKTAIIFGIPSIIAVYLTRAYLLPAIPNHIGLLNLSLEKGTFLMTLFALIMLFAAYSMIKVKQQSIQVKAKHNLLLLTLQGLAIGILSGLIGAGGGFLIIPALIIFSKMPIKKAIGTSLLIVAVNSILGFFSKINFSTIDWKLLITISIISIFGIIIGALISKKIDGSKLKPAFGWFVFVMGIFIFIKEVLL